MNYKRNGLRALGLAFVAAMAFMAFSAGTAQAAKWLVKGAAITKNHTFTGVGALGVLLVPALNLEIHCTSGAASGTLLFAGTNNDGHGSASFNGCKLFSMVPLEENEICTVTVLAATGLLQAVGSDTVLLQPNSGQPFTKVHFGGEECNLEPSYNVTGSLLALVESNNTTAPVLNPSVAQGSDVLKFGAHTSTIDGGKITGTLTTTGEVGAAFGVC